MGSLKSKSRKLKLRSKIKWIRKRRLRPRKKQKWKQRLAVAAGGGATVGLAGEALLRTIELTLSGYPHGIAVGLLIGAAWSVKQQREVNHEIQELEKNAAEKVTQGNGNPKKEISERKRQLRDDTMKPQLFELEKEFEEGILDHESETKYLAATTK